MNVHHAYVQKLANGYSTVPVPPAEELDSSERNAEIASNKSPCMKIQPQVMEYSGAWA